MGIDAGFDLYPSLNEGEMEQWKKFLNKIRDRYRNDPIFVETTDHITFAVGEHPRLDINGMKFRRFSSKISGTCHGAKRYINEITTIAKEFFPNIEQSGCNRPRIYKWNEMSLSVGYDICWQYDWSEVYYPTDKFVLR